MADRVMPHEGKVRAWLSRSKMQQEDIDDVIQETYCRLASLDDVAAVDRPDAYFFSIARNLLTAQMRRQRIVRIDAVADIEALAPFDETPSPERQVGGRIEVDRVRQIVAGLPERCRLIFEMRKIEGISQKEIARRLGVTESTVENDAAKGVRLVLAALRESEQASVTALESGWPQGGAA
ncbi:RNA polymerase sigma factor [Novosphingobium naphthalenivorans]|uniref:RNA polymerase sigma factor n=1 Tax=Novosphingobium naphthalenivorans TaxID=273168 RepID=UPI001FE04274|nr:sigma-70 family RNA polymerase sigma factor [Novosphingobium naphthalenivorans]